ncbi:MAG: hypothetical protein R3200_00845 [Xanthomonadales bacterium]|nr:hypothetical protein [Xanthomonadales bacterium]
MLTILLTLTLAASPVEQVRTTYAEAVAAYRAGDGEALRSAAEQLTELRPGSPQFIYLTAAGAALAGDHAIAVSHLNRLAAMGLALSPDREPAFESLQESEAFRTLVTRFEANAAPRGHAEVLFSLDDGQFIPESVVHDPATGRFFVSSVRQRRIVVFHPDHGAKNFVEPGAHGLMSVMGMRVDGEDRRLLVATVGAEEAPGTPETQLGRSGIMVFDLDSGEPLATHLLPEGPDVQWLGDLLLVEDDQVLATDSRTGSVWQLDLGSGAWSPLVEPGMLSSPQGLVADGSGDGYYIADYTGGLWHLDRNTGTLERLALAPAVNAYGIDGLYRHGESLIAIQNGHRPHRITRLTLDDDGKRVHTQTDLAAGLPEFDDPTLGTIVGDTLYFVANSHWPSFDADKNLPEDLVPPLIMRLELD